MREISRFLIYFVLLLTLILGYGAAYTLVSSLTDKTSHLAAPVNALWITGCSVVLLGCVVTAIRLIQKLR